MSRNWLNGCVLAEATRQICKTSTSVRPSSHGSPGIGISPSENVQSWLHGNRGDTKYLAVTWVLDWLLEKLTQNPLGWDSRGKVIPDRPCDTVPGCYSVKNEPSSAQLSNTSLYS